MHCIFLYKSVFTTSFVMSVGMSGAVVHKGSLSIGM